MLYLTFSIRIDLDGNKYQTILLWKNQSGPKSYLNRKFQLDFPTDMCSIFNEITKICTNRLKIFKICTYTKNIGIRICAHMQMHICKCITIRSLLISNKELYFYTVI